MNQCVETPSCGEVRSEWDGLTADEAGKSPGPAPAGNEPVPDSVSGRAAEKGRVLLLEDDASFREIITDCLAENGYKVVAVENGGEGIREVLAGDFSLILCDLMMPALRGDVFFRAVERIRPELCRRFVFMTGHQGEAVKSEFLKNANALVLVKPFSLKSLLDLAAVTEMLVSYRSLIEDGPDELAGQSADGIADSAKSGLTEKIARILARAQVERPPSMAAVEAAALKEELRSRNETRSLVFAVVGLFMLTLAVFWTRYLAACDGAEKAATERLGAETRLKTVSSQLEESLISGTELDKAQKVSAAIAAERVKPRWTPALNSVIPPGDVLVDILELRVRGDKSDSGACEIRIRGLARGPQPRVAADHYRRVLEASLKSRVQGYSVSTRFEDLAETSGEDPEKMQADFVIVAAVVSAGSQAATSREGG